MGDKDIFKELREYNAFLEGNGVTFTGHIGSHEAKVIMLYGLSTGADNILEIGFNAGHSALVMMVANPNATVNSYEIHEGLRSQVAFKYLKERFGDRFNLHFGDAKEVIKSTEHAQPYDMFFIDGDHRDDAPFLDLQACADSPRTPRALLVMDDMSHNNQRIREFVEQGLIERGSSVLCNSAVGKNPREIWDGINVPRIKEAVAHNQRRKPDSKTLVYEPSNMMYSRFCA